MAAQTLEARQKGALANVWIGAKLLHDGQDMVDAAERLKWIAEWVVEARELQAKIEKRNAKRKAVA